jgi:hypothetical protein
MTRPPNRPDRKSNKHLWQARAALALHGEAELTFAPC